uniref:Mannose-6-phosphate isomerase n=1 Tax=Cyprinodon variegatus TaxID=28743 RepID=A0A3Q2C7M4_CYPVA
MEEVRVFPLTCAVQNYAWGKMGLDSEVAKLVVGGDPLAVIEVDKPYAELWMGAHPKGDAQIKDNRIAQTTLGQWIAHYPACLGSKVKEAFQGQLPFLFKVLSVNTALSIQAHPNKVRFGYKHRKPSTGSALMQRWVLYSIFSPNAQNKDYTKNQISLCFYNLINATKPNALIFNLPPQAGRQSLHCAAGKDTSSSSGDLLLRLHSQYPGDIGCFSIYFLNYVVLEPGQAMFLGANEPHAYIYGDCIECMACSDNTVRAGLTRKYIDVNTLCEMLNYKPASASSKIFPCVPDPADPCVTLYDPPVPDFTVMKIQVPASVKEYTIASVDSASILLVIHGDATATSAAAFSDITLRRGTVLFVSANESVSLQISSQSGMTMFRACSLL